MKKIVFLGLMLLLGDTHAIEDKEVNSKNKTKSDSEQVKRDAEFKEKEMELNRRMQREENVPEENVSEEDE